MSNYCEDDTRYHMTEADEIEMARDLHKIHPARFASCPDCYRFSAHPWQQTFGTQDGTQYSWGGVCAEHGPWRDGS